MKGVDVLWDKQQVPIKILDRIGYDVRARDLSVEVAKAKAVGADLLMPIPASATPFLSSAKW